MDWSSWFRSSKTDTTENATQQNPRPQKQPNHQSQPEQKEEEEQLLGVTQQLIDHVKSFTLDTFKNFPLKEEEEEEGSRGTSYSEETETATKRSSVNVRKDLSDWQQRHAVLVLSKVKELSLLRFQLCPRHLKERQFWRIYFLLVKRYVAEYELRAIKLDKLKWMEVENERPSVAGANEVEMAETKQLTNSPPTTP